MKEHKYKLNQKVKLVGDIHYHKIAKVIALTVQSNEAYASDYCVVIDQNYDSQYSKPKLKKLHVQESDLAEIKTIKLYAYVSLDHEVHYMSDELDHNQCYKRAWARYPNADFEKVL